MFWSLVGSYRCNGLDQNYFNAYATHKPCVLQGKYTVLSMASGGFGEIDLKMYLHFFDDAD